MTDIHSPLLLSLDPLTRHFLDELCSSTGEDEAGVVRRAVAAYHARIVAGVPEDVNTMAARVAAETAQDAVNAPLEDATEDAAGAP
ncbi:hypothetical protein [Deinococcus aquatilis]|jgi:hypothetical protein|uniref:hypothetical protein n=1 Tax=Deinococcus aquatilis TaxID=519440 RepID=UPI00035F9D95|nr:hypothetical protein [Deinococcus aquatilis]